MSKRFVPLVLLAAALFLPLASMGVEAGIKEKFAELIRAEIEHIPLEASDLVAATDLRCSPLNGLVKLDLKLKPLSLKKRASKVEILDLRTIRAFASFDFAGHYELFANGRRIKASDFRMLGEGEVKVGVQGLRVRLADIPFLVLKLADRADACPDISPIRRSPAEVRPGGSYRVAAEIKGRSPGHLAYFVFANNKAAVSADPTLRVAMGARDLRYETPIVTRTDAPPGNHLGNVMAAEIANTTGNALNFKGYEVLFTTGLTMITVK